jgi:hypothetical protein
MATEASAGATVIPLFFLLRLFMIGHIRIDDPFPSLSNVLLFLYTLSY